MLSSAGSLCWVGALALRGGGHPATTAGSGGYIVGAPQRLVGERMKEWSLRLNELTHSMKQDHWMFMEHLGKVGNFPEWVWCV